MRLLYLGIDLLSVAIPLAYSFHPALQFNKRWREAVSAIVLSAALFLIWDWTFTERGIWGFNPRYILGLTFFSLPLEEYLFFLCIPYSCLFTYYCFKEKFQFGISSTLSKIITAALIVGLAAIAVFYQDRAYSAATALFLSLFLGWHQLRPRHDVLRFFYPAYSVLLLPFFIVNGVLTGTFIPEEVVWYNDAETLRIRFGTIPIEDLFYGLLLILLNVTLFEHFSSRTKR